jgi:hypothetical protein
MIQRGKHVEYLKKNNKENEKVITAVRGYFIKDEFKKELLNRWNKIADKMLSQGQNPNNRDLQVYYKILVSSAFLNIHKRNNENGILTPNEEDHKIALNLTMENMRLKWAIPLALKYNKRITDLEALEKILNDGLPEIVRDVLINISPYGKYIKDFS